jgi:hypothetical protein
MTMQTDVKSLLVAAGNTPGALSVSGRSRLKAITIVYGATLGTVVITDGTATGDTLFSFPAPGAAGTIHILMPGEGILAQTGLYILTGTNATAVVYYG